MLNNEIKTEHYTSTFDIPCSTFCGSLLTVGEVRTKLDLSVVKQIVESHGGKVLVRSKEGRGATFILRFPLERRRAIRISRI